tara:strand:- start:397 stop:576 length:180 start_codon:yes stop_codon:yes gene_type:complete
MSKEWLAEIPEWEKQYKSMMSGKLSKRQIELLDGADIKSHEGMIYGQMYADWKLRKDYE